jgi:benzaldehyde dehydrogenase (NAD)
VDAAVGLAAWGSFFHQGQICMTTGRHLVHESIYDDFVSRLAEKAAKLPVGDPARSEVALGPVIDAAQRDKIHAIVTGGGGRVVTGGEFDRLFYQPTVIADTTPDTPAFAEEIFGPVAPVARFGSLDEAVALATATEYGLSLGIVTSDAMRGVALADRVPTGIVHVNDQTVNDEANAPFGGIAASGTGSRFGGAAANIDAFTETRWITVRGQAATYPF